MGMNPLTKDNVIRDHANAATRKKIEIQSRRYVEAAGPIRVAKPQKSP
jgi:hypothetical protein